MMFCRAVNLEQRLMSVKGYSLNKVRTLVNTVSVSMCRDTMCLS